MKSYLLLCAVLLFLVSCGRDPDPSDPFDSCCDNPAIDTVIGNSNVYIPNIFTPDNDGINDVFVVFGDSLRQISSVVITSESGDIQYSSGAFLPNDASTGWDGSVGGETEEGVYDYTIILVAENGQIAVLEGKVCNHPCDDDGKGPRVNSLSKCQFPTQVIDGRFVSTIPSFQSNECFE